MESDLIRSLANGFMKEADTVKEEAIADGIHEKLAYQLEMINRTVAITLMKCAVKLSKKEHEILVNSDNG